LQRVSNKCHDKNQTMSTKIVLRSFMCGNHNTKSKRWGTAARTVAKPWSGGHLKRWRTATQTTWSGGEPLHKQHEAVENR
jgi:hypothetical protein